VPERGTVRWENGGPATWGKVQEEKRNLTFLCFPGENQIKKEVYRRVSITPQGEKNYYMLS